MIDDERSREEQEERMPPSQPAPAKVSQLVWASRRPASMPRHRPFISSDLQAYIKQYWAVMFVSNSATVECAHMRHYVNWYCTRMKSIDVDHHPAGRLLVEQLKAHTRCSQLPILFVNKRLVGTLDDVVRLEKEKKLKDVLQLGFEWKAGQTLCGPLPGAYGDTSLFLGRYQGAPVAKPVMQLPRMHPHVAPR